MLKLGLESGDQGVLDQMKKGFCLEEASRVIKNLREAGISTYVYLLFGTLQRAWQKPGRLLSSLLNMPMELIF